MASHYSEEDMKTLAAAAREAEILSRFISDDTRPADLYWVAWEMRELALSLERIAQGYADPSEMVSP